METVYTSISAILLFWHATWERLLGDASALGTSWAWVLGIVFLVVTVRLVLFPVILRQVRAQRATQRLQPQIKALQEKHRGDHATLRTELAELMAREKASPIAQFLPMFVQIPFVIGLLHVLRHLRPEVTSEASRTLYGWTLTQFDSAVHAKLFGAPIVAGFSTGDLTVQLVAAALIAVMTVTTYLSTRQMIKKSGWATDEPARTVQRIMLYGFPLSLLISGALFPIGVVLYWVTQNLFALAQQAWILRRYPLPPTTPPAAPATEPRVTPATTRRAEPRVTPAVEPPVKPSAKASAKARVERSAKKQAQARGKRSAKEPAEAQGKPSVKKPAEARVERSVKEPAVARGKPSAEAPAMPVALPQRGREGGNATAAALPEAGAEPAGRKGRRTPLSDG